MRFTRRYEKPTSKNKEYTTQSAGGWSTCIKGNPTQSGCNVLSNCVGYVNGRFNEIYNEWYSTTGQHYPYLNCNAENFIERVQQYYPELILSKDPRAGAIMCWAKGSTSGSDGAGHVAIVEDVIDNNTIRTSESNYGGTAFLTKTRSRGNGNWGLNSPYSFRYFIINSNINDSMPTPVSRDTTRDQIEVTGDAGVLRIRTSYDTKSSVLGYANPGFYNIIESKKMSDYTWYCIDDKAWIAGVSSVTKFWPKEDPDPSIDELKKKIEALDKEVKSLTKDNEKLNEKINSVSEIVNNLK